MPLTKKILNALLVILGVVIFIFMLFQFFGDPAKLIAGQTGDKKTMDNIRKDLNLDKPTWMQLTIYLNDISPISIYRKEAFEKKKLTGFFFGDNIKAGIKFPYLGISYQTKKPVTTMIMESLPGTVLLAIVAMMLAAILGVGAGIIAAINKDSWIDRITMLVSISGVSAPSFFIAVVVAFTFGIMWHDYTGLNFSGSLFTINEITGEKELALQNIILPAFTLGIRPMAMIMQLTRSSMLDVLSQDYIRTAYAKGLSNKKVIFKHGLRNAMNPVITAISGWFGELLAGAFFVEFIFGWQGLGKLTIEALEKLDYPVLTGSIVLSAVVFIGIGLITDYLIKKTDPRIE